MALASSVIEQLAGHLDAAELEAREVVKITDAYPDMDWDDAYAIQDAIRRRKEARGCKIAGLKMGLTSRGKWDQMGVREPVYGFLTDQAAVPNGGAVDMSALIHPKVEAEVAFVLKAPLEGGDCSIDQVLEATDVVMPALEVIDSRYLNFKFDIKSVIADNTSAARYMVGGAPRSPKGLDLRNLGIVLAKNGEVVATVAASEVLGHPAESVATLVRMLARRGQGLSAGTLVLTGGATAAVAVGRGDTVEVRCQDLGTAFLRFV